MNINYVATKFINFAFVVSIVLTVCVSGFAQDKKVKAVSENNGKISILVTVMPHNERTGAIAERLVPGDFEVSENKRDQTIISVEKAENQPIQFAVLIQDNLVARVNNELSEIKDFIKGLPENSQVMTAYITGGRLRVAQEFTDDKEIAAKSLRIITSSETGTPFSPFIQTTDALKLFSGQPNGKRILLMISDGLDDTFGFRWPSHFYSLYLDQSIAEAQRQGVTVYTIFAPSAGYLRFRRHAVNYGQGSLLKLADETGGEAFFSGTDFVTFTPYFREFNELLKNQWLITYKSNNTKKGFRKIEVSTEFDLHLHHPAGYTAK